MSKTKSFFITGKFYTKELWVGFKRALKRFEEMLKVSSLKLYGTARAILKRYHENYLKRLFRFWQLTGEICWERDIFSLAQSLSYATVLSLVPMFIIFFFILGQITENAQQLESVQNLIAKYLLPAYAANITELLTQLSKNALGLGLIGFSALIVTGVFLYIKVDTSVNRLWSSLESRGIFKSFTAFLNSALIGPTLVVAVLSMPSYFKVVLAKEGLGTFVGWFEWEMLFLSLTPFLSTFGLFTLLYYFVPTEKVRLKSAMIGAFWISIVIRVVNQLVELYLKSFSKFDLLYGSLTLLPVLMFWLYAMWLCILFGSVLVYVHQSFAHQKFILTDNLLATHSNLDLAFKILLYLTDCFNGRKAHPDLLSLCYSLNSEKGQTQKILKHLTKFGMVSAISEKDVVSRTQIKYQLACSPLKIKVLEILELYSSKQELPHLSSRLNKFFYHLDTAPYSEFSNLDLSQFNQLKLAGNYPAIASWSDLESGNYVINVEKLKLNLKIGIHQWEKTLLQPVELSFRIEFNRPKLSAKDDILLTIDYSKVVAEIKQQLTKKSYRLLETLLDDLLEMLQKIKDVTFVWARINKLYASEGVDKIGVEGKRMLQHSVKSSQDQSS